MAADTGKKEIPLGQVIVENARLSFFEGWKAKSVRGGEPKFAFNLLVDLETAIGKRNDKKIRDAIKAVMIAKWGDNQPKLKPTQLAYRDGDLEEWEGYAGMWYISANNSKRYPIVDRNRAPLTIEDGRPYSGCMVNGVIRLWAQDDEEFGKRVNCTAEGLQYLSKGEAFGAKPINPDDVFEDHGEEEDDSDSLV